MKKPLYVPIPSWKQAEYLALRDLSAETKQIIIPLMFLEADMISLNFKGNYLTTGVIYTII